MQLRHTPSRRGHEAPARMQEGGAAAAVDRAHATHRVGVAGGGRRCEVALAAGGRCGVARNWVRHRGSRGRGTAGAATGRRSGGAGSVQVMGQRLCAACWAQDGEASWSSKPCVTADGAPCSPMASSGTAVAAAAAARRCAGALKHKHTYLLTYSRAVVATLQGAACARVFFCIVCTRGLCLRNAIGTSTGIAPSCDQASVMRYFKPTALLWGVQ